MKSGQKIAIIGGSPIGSTLALFLAKKVPAFASQIDIYEKRGNPLKGFKEEGLTFNWVITQRSIECWRREGVLEQIEKHFIPYIGICFHDKQGKLH